MDRMFYSTSRLLIGTPSIDGRKGPLKLGDGDPLQAGVVLVAAEEFLVPLVRLLQLFNALLQILDFRSQNHDDRIDGAMIGLGLALRRMSGLDRLMPLKRLARPGVPQSFGRLGYDLILVYGDL